MKNDILVSAGILCYNQKAYIRQTIDSILAQKTSFPFEIVIGDDGSTDGTRTILEEYQTLYPEKIRLMPKAPNKGVLKNYRDTLKACRGKYVAFCGGDDYWHNPDKLEMQVRFLEANPDYGVVHTDANYFYENENILVENHRALHKVKFLDGNIFEPLLFKKFEICAITVCCKKEIIDNFVDFEEFERAKLAYEDYPTWMELSRHTKFKFFQESTATYRVINGSISRPNDIQKKFTFLEEKNRIRQFFVNKYNVASDIAREVNKLYYLQKFDLSYKFRNYDRAIEAYEFLQTNSLVNWKIFLKKKILKYPTLYRLADKYNRLIKPKWAMVRST